MLFAISTSNLHAQRRAPVLFSPLGPVVLLRPKAILIDPGLSTTMMSATLSLWRRPLLSLISGRDWLGADGCRPVTPPAVLLSARMGHIVGVRQGQDASSELA